MLKEIENTDKLANVKSILEGKGYTLLDETYGKYTSYLCQIHGVKKSLTSSIKKGHFCKECGIIKYALSNTCTLEYIINRVEIEYAELNLKVIDSEYINQKRPLKVKCLVCSHEFGYYINNLPKKQGCKKCQSLVHGQNIRKPFDKVKLEVDKYNYTLLNIHHNVNKKTLLEVKCSQSHIFKITMGHMKRGDACPDCIKKRTLSESICRKYFEYLFDLPFKTKSFDWLVNNEGNKQLLDGYNSDLNIAFEYDGEQHTKFIKYFHKTQENFIKRQNDDIIKTDLCEKHGLILIRIPYTIQYANMLDFIKNQCIIYDINFENKPNITLEELNVYNNTIQERNNNIDKKLTSSIWIRKSDAISHLNNMTLECKTCSSIRNITYKNLTKIDRKLPNCNYCFREEKTKELQNVISKKNWILTGKYIRHNTGVPMICSVCDYQSSCMPGNIIYQNNIKNCPGCK